jgi:hypothetical protein
LAGFDGVKSDAILIEWFQNLEPYYHLGARWRLAITGELAMPVIVTDLVLFSLVAAFYTGIVIALASLLA